MADRHELAAALAQAARDINAPRDFDTTLRTIVEVARDSMPGIEHVGISLAHRDGRTETMAWTDGVVLEFDQLQYELGEGPCLHAMGTGETIRVEHAEQETRWPTFVLRAVTLGLRSSLSVRLHADDLTIGGLNMYSISQDTVSDETEQMADLFATHAALALGHARRAQNLNIALESRKVIGLALGMLMERLQIDEDTAFAYLTRVSGSTETKLRDVAAQVVEDHQARMTSLR